MASERDMRWSVAQLLTARVSSAGSRSRRVGGRPRFFAITLIDFFGTDWVLPKRRAERNGTSFRSHVARAR